MKHLLNRKYESKLWPFMLLSLYIQFSLDLSFWIFISHFNLFSILSWSLILVISFSVKPWNFFWLLYEFEKWKYVIFGRLQCWDSLTSGPLLLKSRGTWGWLYSRNFSSASFFAFWGHSVVIRILPINFKYNGKILINIWIAQYIDRKIRWQGRQ